VAQKNRKVASERGGNQGMGEVSADGKRETVGRRSPFGGNGGGGSGTGTTLVRNQKTKSGDTHLPGRSPGSAFAGVGLRA